MKYLDMYGQPIQFTYKRSSQYGTSCGIIVSCIVVIIILIYIILYCIDASEMNNPTVLNIPDNIYPPPKYTFVPDIDAIYDGADAQQPEVFKNDPSTGYQMLMLGLKKREGGTQLWEKFNEKTFLVSVKKNTKGVEEDLLIDRCKRVPGIDSDTFNKYQLDQVYCIYSPFELEGNSLDSKSYSMLDINIVCPGTENTDYSKITNSGEVPLPDKNRGNPQLTEPFYKIIKSGTDISKCTYISEYDVYFMYINTIFNHTSLNSPLKTFLDWKFIELGNGFLPTVTAYLQINELTSFKTIVPKSMSSKSTTEYYVSFDDEKYVNSPSSITDGVVASIKINSSDRVNRYERTYINFFDILGKIGGFAKVVVIIGGFFVIYSGIVHLRESMINDFYNVIDPENMEKKNKEFSEFLTELNQDSQQEEKPSQPHKPGEEQTREEKIKDLKNFFRPRVEKLLSTQEKLDKDIDPKDRAEYSVAKIVYGLYQNNIYRGMYYTTGEMCANFFCCCCVTKRLKRKNAIYNKGLVALQKDTDFRSILECVLNFESIKAAFLKKETQLALFKAIANKPFYQYSTTDSGKQKKEKAKEDNSLESIYNSLLSLVDENKTKDALLWDKILVSNLVDKKYKKDAETLIKTIQTMIDKKKQDNELNNNITDSGQKIEFRREDLEKINKKFE